MRRVGGPIAVGVLTIILACITIVALVQAADRTADDIDDARRTIEVAQLQDRMVEMVIALMEERGRRELYGSESVSVGQAEARLDAAIGDLRAARSLDMLDPLARDGLRDLVTALDQIDAVRASPDPGDSYTLMIAEATGALRDANATIAAGSLHNRRAVVALVDLMAALGQQRRLVGLLIVNGPTASTATELQVTTERARAALSSLEPLRQHLTVPVDVTDRQPDVVAVLDRLLSPDREQLDLDRWWQISSREIEIAHDEVSDLTDALTTASVESIDQFEADRRIEIAAIAATVGTTLLVGYNAVATLRARRRAAQEHEAIAAGIQSWFHESALPDIDGMDTAAVYRPASDHANAGGDWYDLFSAGPRVVAVIGDVVGHGAQATAEMASLRNLIRGLVTCHGRLLDVDELHRRLGSPAPMATAAIVAIDRATHSLRYHLAGHPPPLLIRSSGHVDLLDAAVDPPLGTGLPHTNPDCTIGYDIGDTLLLYTDGLIERPGETISDSIATLARCASLANPGPTELIDALTSTLVVDRDDVAVLAIRFD